MLRDAEAYLRTPWSQLLRQTNISKSHDYCLGPGQEGNKLQPNIASLRDIG